MRLRNSPYHARYTAKVNVFGCGERRSNEVLCAKVQYGYNASRAACIDRLSLMSESEPGTGHASPGAVISGARPRALVEDLPLSPESHEDVLAGMARAIVAQARHLTIAFINAETLYHARRNPAYKSFLRKTIYGLCDGVGVIIAGWMWGHQIRRFNGPLLVLKAAEYGLAKGWRHYFYGGKEGVADEMARRLQAKYPGLVVCGTYSPPFRPLTPDEADTVMRTIADAKPDIVWVSLGQVRQEIWIGEYISRIQAPWTIGCGGAFDFHAGAIPWAPELVRKLGLEWLWRLIIEPRMRAKRLWWSYTAVAAAFFRGLFTLQFLKRPTD